MHRPDHLLIHSPWAVIPMGDGVLPRIPNVIAGQEKISDTFRVRGMISSHTHVASIVWKPGV